MRSGSDNTLVPQGRSRTARSESRRLCFAPRSRVHRSRAVSSEGMDRRSRSPAKPRIRALRCRRCDQTTACDENDCTRHRRFCAIQVGCRRYCLRCWRYRTATTPGRQRLCTRGQQRSCISFPWGKAIRRRQGCGRSVARPTGNARNGRGRNQRPRLHDWCYLELADLEVEEFSSANQGLWTRGLLIRRHITDGDLAFFTTWCPAATSIETLVAVEGHRWAIEDSLRPRKTSSTSITTSRSWHGWHRHVSLVMLAFAMMAAIRHRANPPPPKNAPPNHGKHKSTATPSLIRWSIQEVRRIAIRFRFKSESNPHMSSHGLSGVELTRRSLNARTSKQTATVMLVHFDPKRPSGCCNFPGPAELGAVNPYSMHDHGQAACQGHNRLFHPTVLGDLCRPRLETRTISSKRPACFEPPRREPLNIISSPHRDIAPVRSISPD